MKSGVLSIIETELDGDSWEALCSKCYKRKYSDVHYNEIPAAYKGDAGIEGFTQTGVVTQCYCPEKAYNDNELYEHLRDKMTTDIDKLCKNQDRLEKMGVPIIHEWHFVIPEYKDARILEHAEAKRKEVKNYKEKYPQQTNHIADDFKIIVKVAEDYRFEITQLIKSSCTDVKLNFALLHTADVDWNQCSDSDKVNNVKRKIKAIMGELTPDNIDSYNKVVNIWLEAYIKGLNIMRVLRESFADVYEDVFALEERYKKEVTIRTQLNTDNSLNSTIFNELRKDFQDKLKEECKYLSQASIMELELDLVGGWLADCSMEFRGE